VKGRARIGVRFNTLRVDGARYRVQTASINRVAPGTKKDDAVKIGIGAGAGAVVGAIAGGKKGAAIGSAVGGGGGTGVVLATRGREVSLPRGTTVTTRLTEPLTIHLR
jgi:outer membrane lipoprotein SlyB